MSNVISMQRVLKRSIAPLALAAMLTGCAGENEQPAPTIQLPLPEPIKQFAALDGASLSPEVSVNNGTPVIFEGQGLANAWRVSIDVPVSQTGKKYRLLTEAEWEHAARAGTTTAFSTGNTISATQANYNAGISYNGGPTGSESTRSVAVGSYPANPWGIHDLHGNQGEWTCSTVSLSYSDSAELTCNPIEGNPTYAIRGGAWNDPPAGIRSAARHRETPDRSYFYVGFRIAIGE